MRTARNHHRNNISVKHSRDIFGSFVNIKYTGSGERERHKFEFLLRRYHDSYVVNDVLILDATKVPFAL